MWWTRMRNRHTPGRRAASRSATAVALGMVTVAFGAACTAGGDNPLAQPPEPAKPTITKSLPDGAEGVNPLEPLTLTADDGRIVDATLTNHEGVVVPAQLSPDGSTWSTTEVLGYNKVYTLEATAQGPGGKTTTSSQFTTLKPNNMTMPYTIPWDGAVVGIGQPVAVQFDEPIPDRKLAESFIKVTTDPPVEGAFYWVNNTEVRWRPEHYWAPGTTVTVEVAAYGKDFGGGMYGQGDAKSTFTIGDEVIVYANDNTKTITVTHNGQVVRTMPVSFGKNSTPTPNGTYIIAERHANIVMDSSTYGVPTNSANGYRTDVQWATRMSYSGIFVHSAPWSVGDQGYRNVSHGCLNVSPANAQWFYNFVKRGDIVVVSNTVGGTLSGIDGLGDWNIPWSTWKRGNADAQ